MVWLIWLAIFFLADRYLKYLAINNWPKAPQKIVGDILSFNFVPNYRIAFSLPVSGVWLSAFIFIIIVSILSYLLLNKKKLSKLELVSFSAIILGAISNLWDRLQYGYVIDYLDLKWFTVFNIADALISVSTIILFIYLMRKK